MANTSITFIVSKIVNNEINYNAKKANQRSINLTFEFHAKFLVQNTFVFYRV